MDGLTLRPFNELLAEDDRDCWVAEGLVHEGGTLWAAERGAGKSLLTVDLAVALVKGEAEWLGRKIRPGSGPVVFLVSDPKAQKETSKRLTAMGAPDGSVKVGRLRRGPAPVDQWAKLAETLRGTQLVVVDSGTNLVHDIIKPEYCNPLFDGLTELIEADIPVLLVHHFSKSGRGAAGYYGWESWPRWWMYMTKSGEQFRTLAFDGNEVTDLPTTTVVRMPRKTHPGSRFSLAADRRTDPEDRSPERLSRDDELLAKMLQRDDWRNQQHIGEALGISQAKVSRILGDNKLKLTGRSTGRSASAPTIHSFPPYNPPP